MYKLSKIALGLSMLALGLWLILAVPAVQAKTNISYLGVELEIAIPTVQAKSETGFLAMGEWRTAVAALDEGC